jgi:hypothetical protein
LLIDSPSVWNALWQAKDWCQQQHQLCASDAAAAAALTKRWKPAFAQEHKRRGNLLYFRVKADQPELAKALLEQLIQQAEQQDQQARLQRLGAEQQLLQQALDSASTVGERSVLTQQLDNNLAAQNLWRQGYYPALKPVAPLRVKTATAPSLVLSSVVAALLGTLLALTLALLLLRR